MRLLFQISEQLSLLYVRKADVKYDNRNLKDEFTISHKFIDPSSWPVTINSSNDVQAATVAFDPLGSMVKSASLGASIAKKVEREGKKKKTISPDLADNR